MRSVNNMDASTNWRRLCSFAYFLRAFSQSIEHDGNSKDSHLSTILERNLTADLWLSCSSQMSMILIFVPTWARIYLGKDWWMHAMFLLMIFLIVSPAFLSCIFQISWKRWNGLKSWNKRCCEGISWVRPKAWLFDVKGKSRSKQHQ